MDVRTLRNKAEKFASLHRDPRLLILPNIWDPLGARLLERSGYPAVATASAAVAWSSGLADGQRMPFDAMLEVIRRIAGAVAVPMSADVESGYAEAPDAVAANVRRVLHAGAVGINLEDSLDEGRRFFPVDLQCARIRAVREMAEAEGVPLWINARVDVFFRQTTEADLLKEAIERGNAYVEAGADSLYPIPRGDVETLAAIGSACGVPVNAYASAAAAPMRVLERAGVSRLSLGPGLLKASLTAMRDVVRTLREYGPYDAFTTGAMSSDEAGACASGGAAG